MTRSRFLLPVTFVTALFVWMPTWSAAQSATTQTSKVVKSARVDINTASKSDLMALSGINDATAQKIIDGRPYTRKNQLVTKKIVSQTTYDSIKGEIVAKQPKK